MFLQQFRQSFSSGTRRYRKIFNATLDVSKPFGTFIKNVEEAMDLAEAAGCPYAPQQIVPKIFNCILKSQSLPDAATREWKQKSTVEKKLAKLQETLLCRNSGASTELGHEPNQLTT